MKELADSLKVIIAGGRDFDNYELLETYCDKILINSKRVEIISGGAKGADFLGEKYANERRFQLSVFNADWNTHGKYAGIERNKRMAHSATALIAFWDGKSKGTKHMIEYAKQIGLMVRVCRYERM